MHVFILSDFHIDVGCHSWGLFLLNSHWTGIDAMKKCWFKAKLEKSLYDSICGKTLKRYCYMSTVTIETQCISNRYTGCVYFVSSWTADSCQSHQTHILALNTSVDDISVRADPDMSSLQVTSTRVNIHWGRCWALPEQQKSQLSFHWFVMGTLKACGRKWRNKEIFSPWMMMEQHMIVLQSDLEMNRWYTDYIIYAV